MQAPELDLGGFKTVAFDFGQIHMRGGLLNKPMPMTSKTIPLPNRGNGGVLGAKTKTFVKLSTITPWLLLATTGTSRYSHSAFGRTNLLHLLHEKIRQAANGELESSPPPQELGVEEEEDRIDPMDMVELAAEGSPAKKIKWSGKGDRNYYLDSVAKSKVFYADVPAKTREEDPNGTEMRKIALYIQDRVSIWLDIDDVPWAVRFLYIQNLLKGVPLIHSDSTGPSEDNADDSQPRGDGD